MNQTCAEVHSSAAAESQLLPAEISAFTTLIAARFIISPSAFSVMRTRPRMRPTMFFSRRCATSNSSARLLGPHVALSHCYQSLQECALGWHDRHVLPSSDNEFIERLPGGDSPLHILETKELGERIQRALDGLPAEYRLLLLLVSDQELSYQEAGALTGQSADAVRGNCSAPARLSPAFLPKRSNLT